MCDNKRLLREWEAEILSVGKFKKNGIPLELKAYGKTVYFIRHAKSIANEATERGVPPELKRSLPEYRDCYLADTGVKEALDAQELISQLDIELIIVSPLSRTIQTFCYAFDKHPKLKNIETPDIEITVSPLVCEFYLHYQECQGRNKQQLLEDEKLKALRLFPTLIPTLSKISKNWWNIGDNTDRLTQFSAFIRSCAATKIAVVSHWGFIHNIFLKANNISIRPSNCECYFSVWRTANTHYHLPSSLSHQQLLCLSTSGQSANQIMINNEHLLGGGEEEDEDAPNRYYSIIMLPAGNHHKNGLLNEIISFISEVNAPECIMGGLFFIPLMKFQRFDPIHRDVSNIKQRVAECRNSLYSIKELYSKKHPFSIEHATIGFTRHPSTNDYVDIYFEIFDQHLEHMLSHLQPQLLENTSFELPFRAYILHRSFCDANLPSTTSSDSSDGGDSGDSEMVGIDNSHHQHQYKGEPIQNILKKYPALHGGITREVNYGWEYLFGKLTWRLALASYIPGDFSSFRVEKGCSYPLW